MREGWCLHDFQILLVLSSGARRHFVEPLAGMIFHATPTSEGCEELIMTVNGLPGNEGAHRKAVDKQVVEGLIFERIGNRNLTLVAFVGFSVQRQRKVQRILTNS